MENKQISDIWLTKLKADLLRNKVTLETLMKQRQKMIETGEHLFEESYFSLLEQEIDICKQEMTRIMSILEHTTVLKIEIAPDTKVQSGDIVSVLITYKGEPSQKIRFQIDGESKDPEIVPVTSNSPIGLALLGKEKGESFSVKEGENSPVSVGGFIRDIQKNKNLEQPNIIR